MTRSPQNHVVPLGSEQQTKQDPGMQISMHVIVRMVRAAASLMNSATGIGNRGSLLSDGVRRRRAVSKSRTSSSEAGSVSSSEQGSTKRSVTIPSWIIARTNWRQLLEMLVLK